MPENLTLQSIKINFWLKLASYALVYFVSKQILEKT